MLDFKERSWELALLVVIIFRFSGGHALERRSLRQGLDIAIERDRIGLSNSSLAAAPLRGLLDEQHEHLLLAKYVPAETNSGAGAPAGEIPRILWQTYRSDGRHDKQTMWVERERAEVMLTWLDLNPTWEYRLLDDDDIEDFIRAEYGAEELSTFQAISQGASRADFFRALVMYRHGGAYFDTDSMPRPDAPLDAWVESDATFITGVCSWRSVFHQWGLIAAKGSCVFERLIANIKQAVATQRWTQTFQTVEVAGWDESSGTYELKLAAEASAGKTETFAGPGALQNAALSCLKDRETKGQFLDGFRLCPRDMFSGRVVAKAESMKDAESSWNDAMPVVDTPQMHVVSYDPLVSRLQTPPDAPKKEIVNVSNVDMLQLHAASYDPLASRLPTPPPYAPKKEAIGPLAKDGYEICAPVKMS